MLAALACFAAAALLVLAGRPPASARSRLQLATVRRVRMPLHLEQLWARCPDGLRAAHARRAQLAGEPVGGPVLRQKLVALTVAGALIAVTLAHGLTPLGVVFIGLVAFGAWSAPDLAQLSRGRKRQDAIRRELADTVDQLAVCLQAGLGFDAALARLAAAGTGPLADELAQVLRDITLGCTRPEALERLLERTDVPELRHLVVAIRQADRYGISLATTLRLQAAELRDRRTQWAEEQATKLPVKLLFPLMLCIMPALFIVLLGPVAIKIVSGGLGM